MKNRRVITIAISLALVMSNTPLYALADGQATGVNPPSSVMPLPPGETSSPFPVRYQPSSSIAPASGISSLTDGKATFPNNIVPSSDWKPGDPMPGIIKPPTSGSTPPPNWKPGDPMPGDPIPDIIKPPTSGSTPPPNWKSGDPIPSGMKVSTDGAITSPKDFAPPPNWKPGDPIPSGMKVSTDGAIIIPKDFAPPPNWKSGDPIPSGIKVSTDGAITFPKDSTPPSGPTPTPPSLDKGKGNGMGNGKGKDKPSNQPPNITTTPSAIKPTDIPAGVNKQGNVNNNKAQTSAKQAQPSWKPGDKLPSNVVLPKGWRLGDPLPGNLKLPKDFKAPKGWKPGDPLPKK
jgi:hypothetical protein